MGVALMGVRMLSAVECEQAKKCSGVLLAEQLRLRGWALDACISPVSVSVSVSSLSSLRRTWPPDAVIQRPFWVLLSFYLCLQRW